MAVTELIYVSTLVGEAEHEIKAMLESAVRHNTLNGITGMLLYCRGAFLQVLEGAEPQVTETYRRICEDRRHQHITCLSVSQVPLRQFGKWSMGFKHVSDGEIAQFPQLEPVFNYRTRSDVIRIKPALALDMLNLFGMGTVWRASANPASVPAARQS